MQNLYTKINVKFWKNLNHSLLSKPRQTAKSFPELYKVTRLDMKNRLTDKKILAASTFEK